MVPLLLRRHLLGHGPLGAAEEPAADRGRPQGPHQADDPRPGRAARSPLEAFINALLEASISVLTSAERAACDGGTGLDATPVPLFSRGPSRRTGLCASDPDGGWYVREGDHREREDDKGRPLRKIAWALEATIATTARPPGAPPAHPDLAIGLALARPGEDPGGTGARVLASIAARGHKAAGSATTVPTPPGSRAIPAARPRPGLPAGHGLPDRTSPASRPIPAAPSWPRAAGTARPARAADQRHHPAARPRHHPRALRPADRRRAPTSSSTKTAPAPTATSGCPARRPTPTPG